MAWLQMTVVVAQIHAAQHSKKNKYEYDSDEETEGGTWEHKLRAVEMQTTKGYILLVPLTKPVIRELSCHRWSPGPSTAAIDDPPGPSVVP